MSGSPQELAAQAVLVHLRGLGFQAFYAGGCVRDVLLGLAPKDFDVATSATPEVVLGAFPRTFAVGAHFGVVLVVSQGPAGEEIQTEVATFRSDGAYADGRHPEAVRFSQSAEQDVQRRDFTINGMLLDPLAEAGVEGSTHPGNGPGQTGTVLDFVGGRADLRAGLVRAIGDPARRFAEDKLRMLRAVRFAARFTFVLEAGTESALRAEAAQVLQVSCERIRDELTRMLTEGHARRAFELLEQTGLLEHVLPEVARMRGVEQPPDWHPEGDVWVHTLLLLEKLPAGCSPTLAWGALLHDVGKPPTFVRAADRIRFSGHAEVGTRMAAEICRRLRFSTSDTEQIEALVANHMRFGDVERMKESTLKRFLRLRHFDEHLHLHWLDCSASHGLLGLYDYAKRRYEETPAEEVRPVLLVSGRDLLAAGYKPGPRFREWLALAEDAQLEGRISSKAQGLALIAEHATLHSPQNSTLNAAQNLRENAPNDSGPDALSDAPRDVPPS